MKDGAHEQKFEREPGKVTTVEKYFAEVYPRTKLLYPHLNLIRAAPETRTIYLPIEVSVYATFVFFSEWQYYP